MSFLDEVLGKEKAQKHREHVAKVMESEKPQFKWLKAFLSKDMPPDVYEEYIGDFGATAGSYHVATEKPWSGIDKWLLNNGAELGEHVILL